MSDALSEHPERDERVIWHGRPQVWPSAPDLWAGACALLATFAVLAPGLAAQSGWAWGWALRLAAVYAALVGCVTGLVRAVGAGRVLTACCAFTVTVALAALVTAQEGLSLLCPLLGGGVLCGLVLLRFRQLHALRDEVRRDRELLGERGRYVIAFPLEALPRVRADWFGGGLGSVEFGRQAATLTTRDGRVFKVPPQPRVFRRVAQPQQLLERVRAERDADPRPVTG